MVDSVSSERRSEIMALIPTRDTRPERIVKKALWTAGFRHARSKVWRLPGSPDLIYPARGTVVFVHGCFWHGHKCVLGRTPKSNQAFWVNKVSVNRRRDARATKLLRAYGWRVVTVWECALNTGISRAERVLSARRVPQKRERVFFVGFREDLGAEWSFPPPSHSLDSLLRDQWISGDYWDRHRVAAKDRYAIPDRLKSRVFQLRDDLFEPIATQPWRTVRDAIRDLPDPRR